MIVGTFPKGGRQMLREHVRGFGLGWQGDDSAFEQDEKQPVSYAAGTILTTDQVADWLQLSTRQVIQMRLPRLVGLGRSARYEAGAILRHLAGPSGGSEAMG